MGLLYASLKETNWKKRQFRTEILKFATVARNTGQMFLKIQRKMLEKSL